MRRLEIGVETVTHLAFSPDGTLLAASGYRGIGIGPWPALAEGRGPFAITPSREKVAQVAWHPDGYYFAAAGVDSGIIQVWDIRLRVRKDLIELPGQHGPMTAVTFDRDGHRLAFGGGWWPEPGADKEVASAIVVQTSTWRPLRELEGVFNQVGAIVFTRPDVVVTGAGDRFVVIHPLNEPPETARAIRVPSPVQALAVRPDGNRLAVAAGNAVRLWTVGPTGRPTQHGELLCRGHKVEGRGGELFAGQSIPRVRR